MILNPSQERAVKNHGHQRILAGPGSGKTRVITEKILYLIDHGVPPGQVLALTFSEKAAKEMLGRLDVQTDTHELTIGTFHAFCNSVLEDNVLDSGISFKSGVISRANQLVWGLRNIDNFGFEYIEVGNNAPDIIESMMDGISAFRDELITTDELESYIIKKQAGTPDPEEEDAVGKLSDLLRVYRAYEKYKRSEMLLDFDDMIHETVRLFERKPLVLDRYRNRFRHILVDEFQDTNYAQLQLVKQLAGDHVCIVGDDDQTIYRFRGAYLTNFLDFQRYFPQVEDVLLDHNYRNSSTILSLALQLMDQAPNRTEKALITKNPPGDPATVAWCENERAEAEFVLAEINQLFKTSFLPKKENVERLYQPRDIAIICRRRLEGLKYYQILRRNGIPAEFVGDIDIFSTPAVRDVLACLRVINNPLIAGIPLNRIMKISGIPETTVQKINAAAREISRRDRVHDGVFEAMGDADALVPGYALIIGEILATLQALIGKKDRVSLAELVHAVTMEGTGAYARALDEDEGSSIAVLNKFQEIARDYEAITTDPTLDDFLTYTSLLSGVSLDVSDRTEENSVQVLTAHKSKGKEFPVVFVVDMVAGKFPLNYRKKTFQVPGDLSRGLKTGDEEKALFLQEERRLCYVAMTRAEDRLYFTLARWYGELKTEKKPSKFLEELTFKNNPLIRLIEVTAETGSKDPDIAGNAQEFQWHLQEQARNAISQMQLHTAVQRLVDLAKIRLLSEGRSPDEFDPGSLFQYTSHDEELTRLFRGEKERLIRDTLAFSATSLADFEKCPRLYKFRHILQIPGSSKTYFDLGSAVHNTVQELSKLEANGVTIDKPLALEVLSKFWSSRSYASRTHEEEDLVKAGQLLDTYLQWRDMNQNTIIGVERKFRFELGTAPLTGKIDHIEQSETGEIFVIDYKTGKTKVTKKSLPEDIQLNVYCLAIQQMYGRLPLKASLFYLHDNTMYEYAPSPETTRAFSDRVQAIIRTIYTEQFEPGPAKNCRFCDYGPLCEVTDDEGES